MELKNSFWLDSYHFITPLSDGDNIKWALIKTYSPKDENGNIVFDHLASKYFDITIIDPDNFLWKGKRLKLFYEMEREY